MPVGVHQEPQKWTEEQVVGATLPDLWRVARVKKIAEAMAIPPGGCGGAALSRRRRRPSPSPPGPRPWHDQEPMKHVSPLLLSLLLLCYTCQWSLAATPAAELKHPNDQLFAAPWSMLLYGGRSSTVTLGETFWGRFDDAGESIFSYELAYVVPPAHALTRLLDRLGLAVQLAGNLAARIEDKGPDPNVEIDVYAMLRWHRLPWNRFVATTFAVGEGFSYVSRIPAVETHFAPGSNPFLNFLTFELTVASPRSPRLQLVTRIHHRSGIFGVFGVGKNGSNAIGVGLRYHFEIGG